MAARRGVLASRAVQSSALAVTLKGLSASLIFGPALEKLAVGGRVLFWKASRVFISPAEPAAVSKCPTLDLTEPRAHCPALQPRSPQSVLRLSTSIGSPVGVPVAWHSMWSICEGESLACL